MVIAPIQRVRFLTQCQNEMIKSGRLSHLYKGIGDCFDRTIRNEGIRNILISDGIVGLYRGCNITLYEIFPAEVFSRVMRFALKPSVQLGFALFGLQNNPEAGPMAEFGLNIICSTLPTYPMDTVHRRMMMRSGEAIKYKNWLNAFYQTLKNEGVKSLYKGAGAEALRMPLYICVKWLLVDLSFMKIKWKNEGNEANDSNNSHQSFYDENYK
ncbi:hypothetical protein Dsin_021188 [Dipteronia sinensis]|uniref:ADP/ATP translocase n=1 Tax=Dipteronia sinensis TaxID=43782 RepID=A0AAE0AB57_9ROSI|nr:hypothetical protein Dsin_021188 [Dipteronia sinensis]